MFTGNMRIFLGALVLLIVSGDDDVPMKGILGESVLLRCNCINRNLSAAFWWQSPKCRINNNSTINTSCRGQAEVFVADCSLLLHNLTADDQGKYRCGFYIDEMYKYSFINLTVSAGSTCDEKDKSCNHTAGQLIVPSHGPEQTKYVMRYYKAIPIGVVFVLSLALWRRWRISRGQLRGSEEREMDNCEC